MTEGERPVRRSRMRRIVTGCAWLLGGSVLALAAVIAVAWILVIRSIGPDCVDPRSLTSSQYTGKGSVDLDAARPMAEQRVTLNINAAALPLDVPTTTTLLVRPPDMAPAPSLATGGTEAMPVPAVVPELTILDDDTGEVLPATMSWAEVSATSRSQYVSIPIDCQPGAECTRTYRIRAAVPGLTGTESLEAAWLTQAQLRWEGVDTACGQPRGARVDLEAEAPRRVSADAVAFSPIVAREETARPLITRHITVTSDRVLAGASIRLSLLRTDAFDPDSRVPTWRQWVRVLPDGGGAPAADALVGGAQYGTGPGGGGTVDVPILVGCPSGGNCERGYWIVFQTFPVGPAWPGSPVDPGLGDDDRFRWAVTATGSTEGQSRAPSAIAVQADDGAGAVPTGVSMTSELRSVTLTSNKVPTALDVTLTIPERPRAQLGLDPLAASVAVIHVAGHGYALVPEVRGPGAGPIRGYINGDGAANLVAHPFDACPPSGACSLTLELVGTFNVERTGGQADSADMEWRVELLGVPPDTTIAFGEPHELPKPTDPGLLPAAAIVTIACAGLILVVGISRRRRRIGARQHTSSEGPVISTDPPQSPA